MTSEAGGRPTLSDGLPFRFYYKVYHTFTRIGRFFYYLSYLFIICYDYLFLCISGIGKEAVTKYENRVK